MIFEFLRFQSIFFSFLESIHQTVNVIGLFIEIILLYVYFFNVLNLCLYLLHSLFHIEHQTLNLVGFWLFFYTLRFWVFFGCWKLFLGFNFFLGFFLLFFYDFEKVYFQIFNIVNGGFVHYQFIVLFLFPD